MTMRIGLLFLLLVFGLSAVSVHAEIYRWVDAAGNTVYGDNPPKQSAAKPVDLPLLTVADSPAPKPEKREPEPAKGNSGGCCRLHGFQSDLTHG